MPQTPFYGLHQAAGAKMVDFHNWLMPLHYGSQLAEHHAVRQTVGLFDVSHMTVFDVAGESSRDFLRYLLPSDVERLKKPGQALYSALLNSRGGIIDDLILYAMPENTWRLITNCATRDRIRDWLQQCSAKWQQPGLTINERADLAILAVQGPRAFALCQDCLPEHREAIADLQPFSGRLSSEVWLAQTGYTGEDGLEIIAPEAQAIQMWEILMHQGVQPAGLGARDTLRLEAGLNLYGQDMDESCTPLESNMAKIIHWQPEDRNFVGRQVLAEQKRNRPDEILTGLILQEAGIPRSGCRVYAEGRECGLVTSGLMSPTLKQGIALARIKATETATEVAVEIRNHRKSACLQKPPFYRRTKK